MARDKASARHCARVKEGQKAQQRRGRCRQCRRLRQPGSRARCPGCLELDRRKARLRRGITTTRSRTPRGRPLIGTFAGRGRALAHDERLRERREAQRPPPTPSPRRVPPPPAAVVDAYHRHMASLLEQAGHAEPGQRYGPSAVRTSIARPEAGVLFSFLRPRK